MLRLVLAVRRMVQIQSATRENTSLSPSISNGLLSVPTGTADRSTGSRRYGHVRQAKILATRFRPITGFSRVRVPRLRGCHATRAAATTTDRSKIDATRGQIWREQPREVRVRIDKLAVERKDAIADADLCTAFCGRSGHNRAHEQPVHLVHARVTVSWRRRWREPKPKSFAPVPMENHMPAATKAIAALHCTLRIRDGVPWEWQAACIHAGRHLLEHGRPVKCRMH